MKRRYSAGGPGATSDAEQPHDVEMHGPAAGSNGVKGASSIDTQAAGEGTDEGEDALEGDASAWMEDSPQGFGQQLSRFGILFMLLDGMVTESTLQYLQGTSSGGHSFTASQARLLTGSALFTGLNADPLAVGGVR